MRKISGLLLIGVLLLSGCTSAPTPEPTETIDAPTNAEACAAFESTTADLANRMVEGSDDSNAAEFVETMAGMRGRFDEAALSGQGEVSERIETLVDNLPAKVHMLFLEHDAYFEDIASVDRACAAEGHPVNPTIWE